MPPDRSSNSRDSGGKLNPGARNLILFSEQPDGTREHHLRASDYSRWFRDGIKDPELAAEAAAVEADRGLSPRESRARVRGCIEKRYTLPAGAPLPMPGTDNELRGGG